MKENKYNAVHEKEGELESILQHIDLTRYRTSLVGANAQYFLTKSWEMKI